jgi:hypothetical protein
MFDQLSDAELSAHVEYAREEMEACRARFARRPTKTRWLESNEATQAHYAAKFALSRREAAAS